MPTNSNSRNETLRTFRCCRDAVVALDELSTGDIVDLIVLMVGIGDPGTSERHQTSAVDRLTTLVEVVQLVGDVTGGCADGIADEVADGGQDGDSDRDDERANESADLKRHKRQRGADCRTDGDARDGTGDRADGTSDCGVVSDVRADFAV